MRAGLVFLYLFEVKAWSTCLRYIFVTINLKKEEKRNNTHLEIHKPIYDAFYGNNKYKGLMPF